MPATYAPGLNKPYFKPTASGLPIKEKPPPIAIPSAPNLNLFLNLTIARSDPVKPSSLSFSATNVGVSGSLAKKSVAPKAPAIYPARFAICVLVNFFPAAILFAFDIALPLAPILKIAPPGIPY